MVKRWVLTATVNRPEGTVSGRYGGSVLFVAYRPLLGHWLWIFKGGESRVGEPPMIFVDEEWARANRNLSRPGVAPKKSLAIRRKRNEQLLLF
jgi:hypothetical protein